MTRPLPGRMSQRRVGRLTDEEARHLRLALRAPGLTDPQKHALAQAVAAARRHYLSLRDGQGINRTWTAAERGSIRAELETLSQGIDTTESAILEAFVAALDLVGKLESLSENAEGWLRAAGPDWNREAEADALAPLAGALGVLCSQLGCSADPPAPLLDVLRRSRGVELPKRLEPKLGDPWTRAEDRARRRLGPLRDSIAQALALVDGHRAPTRSPDLAAGMVGLELLDAWVGAQTSHGPHSRAFEDYFLAAVPIATGKPDLDGRKLLQHVREATKSRAELSAELEAAAHRLGLTE